MKKNIQFKIYKIVFKKDQE